MGLNSFDNFFAKQALRAKNQENQGHHIGKPFFNAAAEIGLADVDFGKLLADAADDCAGNRCEAAQDQHRQGL